MSGKSPDFGGLGSFLGKVDRALTVLGDGKHNAKAKVKAGAQGQPDSPGEPKDVPKQLENGGDRGK